MASGKKVAQVSLECVACGNCAKYCPFGAILIPKGLWATVDEANCKGCGRCVNACPADVIHLHETEAIGA